MPPHTATPRSPAAASLLEVEQAGRPGGLHHRPARLTARSTTQHSSAILFGGEDPCQFLAAELRPVPPQPNCPQSMRIYEDHRKLAADFLRVQAEAAELRSYKAQLVEQIQENEAREVEGAAQPSQQQLQQFSQLREEKDALLAFREKLEEQLQLIEAAQQKRSAGSSAHSSQGGSSTTGTDEWVVVNSKPPG